MPIQIEERKEQGCLVIEVRGSFETAMDAKSLRSAVGEALARGQTVILLNLSEISKLDDFGAESVFAASFMTTHNRGLFKIFGGSPLFNGYDGAAALLLRAESERLAIREMLDTAARDGIETKPFDILEFVREEEKRNDEMG